MPTARENVLSWLGNGLTTAQKEDSNTTLYLDTVDIPPIVNHGPQPTKLDNKNVPLTDLSASAANGLRSESKINGVHVSYLEDLVEKISATPA